MVINLYLVDILIHYLPIYMAIIELRNEMLKENIRLEIIPHCTNSDRISIDKFINDSKEKRNEIHLLLTSTIDLEKRINDFEEIDLLQFYEDFIIWTTLIDKIPICIIGDKSDIEFFSKFPENLSILEQSKIASYPVGSTSYWFSTKKIKYFQNLKESNFEFVDFGKGKEFELIENKTVRFAITLEFWKSAQYNNIVALMNMPRAPLGFTALFTPKYVFYNENQNKILTKIKNYMANSVKNIYKNFEIPGYEWILPNERDIFVDNAKESFLKMNKMINSEYILNFNFNDSLRFLSENEIWSLDSIKVLEIGKQKILTPEELMFEEKRFVSSKLISIHDLKDDLLEINREVYNLNEIEQDDKLKYRTLMIYNSIQSLVDNYENYLNSYKKEDKVTYEDLARIFKEECFAKEFGTYDVQAKKGIEYWISFSFPVLKFILKGLLKNAIMYCQQDTKPMINLSWDVYNYNIKNYISICIENDNASNITSNKLKNLGYQRLVSVPGKSNGSFYKLINDYLKISNAIEYEDGRYFQVNYDKENKIFKTTFSIIGENK
ncbi:MAG: hypothetical protein HW421_1172 [Ignavibacteria bacterium]|nr:hypothetical protein [Ignavibacteria bacterium]